MKFNAQAQRALPLLLMLALLLLAAAVRWHGLGAQSLWNDEGNSYVQSLRGPLEIADAAGRDIHPPLYYWTLAGWRLLVGHSEFALRALSSFYSILSVALIYALGRRLYGPAAGLAAAAFVTLNTGSIYYAQEARMYAMLAPIAAGSMWALVVFLRRPSLRSGLALALLNAAGLYTHYIYPPVMLAQGLLALLWLGTEVRDGGPGALLRPLRAYVAANLLSLAIFLPWLPTAYRQLTTWPNLTPEMAAEEALRAVQGWLAFGLTFEQTLSNVSVAVYFFLLFGLLVMEPHTPKRHWWRMLLPVLWVLVTVGLLWTLQMFPRYLHFMIAAQAGFALWLGRGVWVLWHIRTRERSGPIQYVPRAAALFSTLILLANMAGGLPHLYEGPQFQRDDYRAIAGLIAADTGSGRAVILSAPNQAEVFHYYYSGDAPVYSLPTSPDPDHIHEETLAIITGHEHIYAVLWGAQEQDPLGVVQGTLNREAYEASDDWYGNVRLVRYAAPVDFVQVQESGQRFGEHITLVRYALGPDAAPGQALRVQLVWTTGAQLTTRYAVFVQLLNPDGTLAAQRDSEPAGGDALTTLWRPGEPVTDNHALLLPELPPGTYTLIMGLYNAGDPFARLPVAESDHLVLAQIELE